MGPSDLLFADGFETGSTARWSQRVGGSLLTTTTATTVVPAGTHALTASVVGKAASYVQTDSPNSESSYRARFDFDPQGTTTRSAGHDILAGVTPAGGLAFHVVYRRTSEGVLQVRSGAVRSGGQGWTSWTTITDAPHTIGLSWTAGSRGTVSLSVDGVLCGSLSRLANSTTRVESVRLGPSSGLSAGSHGVEIFDAFVSTRTTPIGP